MKLREPNVTAEILAELERGPMMLGALSLRVGAAPSKVLRRLKRLAQLGKTGCARHAPPAAKRDERLSDRVRLVWRLRDRPLGDIPSDIQPPRVPLIRQAPRRKTDPHKDTRPEPIEILARMAGRSNFLTPKTTASATNTIPVTPLDIAHAIGVVSAGCAFPEHERAPNPLGASMAMAMACQRQAEWPRIELHGRPRLLHHLRAQRQHTGLVEGPNAYRARIGLFDAFHDLVLPAQRRNLGEAAKHARMRKDLYRYLLNESIAFLEAAANTAAADAVRYLFSLAVMEHPLTSRVRAVSVNDRGEIRVWTSAAAEEVESESDQLTAMDISLLCRDVLLTRARRPGILALSAAQDQEVTP